MATSGSFDTNVVGSFYVTFEWVRTSYDVTANTNTVYYKFTAHNTPGNYRTVYNMDGYVNGTKVIDTTSGTPYYDGDIIAEGYTTINNNASGDGSFSASFNGGVGTSSDWNCSGSGSWNLDRIPRYAEISEARVQSTGLTTATIKYTVSRNANIYCSVDDGAYGNPRVQNTTTGTFTITGLSPNVNHKFKILARAVDSGLDRESSLFYGKTKDIARITLAPNIDHGDNITVQYSNESNSSLDIGLFLIDGITSIRNYATCTGNSYTFNFTDEELDNIYKLYGTNNQITLRVYLRTAGSFIDYAELTIALTGNQKTIKVKVNGIWKRGKIFINKNRTPKRAVIWTYESTGWKRGI